ncbi:MAG: FAD:protein FMN transferase [Actinobacteria bacterium]|nr:FAD:protein FMN transferase [Actinomycetota bacterium]
MASQLHIIAVDTAETRPHGFLDDAAREAAAFLDELERHWSRFIESSDVSRINDLASTGGTIEVDSSTMVLLTTMIEGHAVTAGRFDPTVLRSVIAEGYDTSWTDLQRERVSTPAAVRSPAVAAASLHDVELYDVELHSSTNTVTVPPGLMIDPGGIGKGLAADLTVARLIAAGIDGAMVEIGGDLSLAGTPVDPTGWLIEVERVDPADGVLCTLAISGGGVATSSVRSRRWVRDGVERHHQIDPSTATCSTTDLAAVTVIAPAGWLAEVHATAALAAGSDNVISYLDGHGLSGLALAVSPSGERVWTTSDLQGLDLNTGSGVR